MKQYRKTTCNFTQQCILAIKRTMQAHGQIFLPIYLGPAEKLNESNARESIVVLGHC
jgi:hypothetical protein